MCTVLVSFSPGSQWPLLMLGTRDEFADRPWDPPAAWWPRRRGIVGGRDREAGGTWLAVNPGHADTGGGLSEPPRMSVVLNRWQTTPEPPDGWLTRGALPLAAAADDGPAEGAMRYARAFNLLTATSESAEWVRWDGTAISRYDVTPGIHLLTSADLDDPDEPRVDAWLRPLRDAKLPHPEPAGSPGSGWAPWLDLLQDSASRLPGDDQRAVIRRRSVDGRLYGTLALCAVSLTPTSALFDFAALPAPGDLPEVGTLGWARVVGGV